SQPVYFVCSFPVAALQLQITGTCPTQAVQGSPLVVLLSAAGGKAPYAWSYSGPSWLPLSSTTGSTVALTGTPPSAETYFLSLTLADSAGPTASPFNCVVKVAPPPLQITSSAACPTAPLLFNSKYLVSLAAAGGTPPYSWAYNGPSWLSLASPTGAATA